MGEEKPLKVCIKLPTRSRVHLIDGVLEQYEAHIARPNTELVLTIDKDDQGMMNWAKTKKNLAKYLHLSRVQITLSKNKVQACNSGLRLLDYDVMILASDDMLPVWKGFDQMVLEDMVKHFPDMDGSLWYSDNLTSRQLITYPVLGVKYVEYFGYVYNPKYQGLFCDNELTEVARMLKKLKRIDKVLLEHHHWTNKKRPIDDLYRRYAHDMFYQDKQVWKSRKAQRYEIT